MTQYFPFKDTCYHLIFISQCEKISRIGQNWTSEFLTNNHPKALIVWTALSFLIDALVIKISSKIKKTAVFGLHV